MLRGTFRRLYVPAGEARFLDVLALLRAHPELTAINAHVRQRQAREKPASVLIRCDGGHRIGLGHVVRCLAVATVLRDRFSAAVTFALGGDEAAFALVRAHAFAIRDIPAAGPATALLAAVKSVAPDVVLLDIRTPFDAAEFASIREAGCRLAVLDDSSARRLYADVCFFPPTGAALDWQGATGERCVGFEWIPLREQFAVPPPPARAPEPLALIAPGGSDPAGIGKRWLAAAARALPPAWRIGIVLGAATVEDAQLEGLTRQLGNRLTLYRQVSDMAALMAHADLALASFGMTAYELAALGVPMLLLCLSDEHQCSALNLQEHGAARVLGIFDKVDDDTLDRAISEICADEAVRADMSRRARQLVDGRGAYRIAERIAGLAKTSPRSTGP